MARPAHVATLTLSGMIAAALLGAIFVAGLLAAPLAQPRSTGQSRSVEAPAGTVLRTDTISRIARARTNSVVLLHVIARPYGINPAVRPEEMPVLPPALLETTREALGSGVVIDRDGGILTNAHVLEGMRTVHVRTPFDDDRDAMIVAADPVTDLALLRVTDPTGLQPAPLGDSDHLQVGDLVIAMGSPFGLHHTVTLGIVSAKDRVLGDEGIEFLQTDAAINPGSSGGPIFDLAGSVVGISTALLSGGGQNLGLNFAVPINVAKELLPQLRSGEVVHGWMGVHTIALTRSGARYLGLGSQGGLAVTKVVPGGPADQAGIDVSDIILGSADEVNRPARDLLPRVRRAKPGTIIRLRVWRNNETREVNLTVGRWSPER